MTLIAAISLFWIMLALAAVPSASVALVVGHSATGGLRNGLAVTAGIVLADLLFVALAIGGLTALAEMMGAFFVGLRYVAGAYLIWFGINLLRSCRKKALLSNAPQNSSFAGSFVSGFFLTLGDLKAILFYASLFPAFVDLTRLSLVDCLLIAILTALTVGGVKTAYAIAAQRLLHSILHPKKAKLLRASTGTLMIGTGSYLFLKP